MAVNDSVPIPQGAQFAPITVPEQAAPQQSDSVPIPQGAQFASITAQDNQQEPGVLGKIAAATPVVGPLLAHPEVVTGPGTALGAQLSPGQQSEVAAVTSAVHGDFSHLGDIVHAETPHVVAGSPLEKLIQKFNPNFRGGITSQQADLEDQQNKAGLNNPLVEAASKIDKNEHPVAKALAEAAQSMTSPGNIAVLIGTGGLGMVESPKLLGVANRLISAGFAASSIGQAYKQLKSFKEAYDNGDANEALYQLTHATTSGVLGYLAGSHAAGVETPLASETDKVVAGAVGKGAQTVGNAVAGTAGNIAEGVKKGLGLGDDFYTTVKKISPPSKGAAMEYNETLKAAEPQLREVFKQNPDVGTPKEMYDAIDQHIQQTEARLGEQAAKFKGKPEARMTGIENKVRTDLEKAFDENPGQYKPAEREQAIQAVLDHLLQEEPGQLEGTKTLREPDLAKAEGVRQRFNQDTKPAFGSNAPSVPAAESFAKQIANKSIREAVDQKFDDLGVKDVKQWRQQEAPLIDVRDQIAKAVKKADEMGTYNVFESLTKQLGWKTLLGFAAGAGGGTETGLAGALAASGLGAIADYIRDLKTNPSRKVVKAGELARASNEPTGAALPREAPVNPTQATGAPDQGSVDLELRKGAAGNGQSEGTQKPATVQPYGLPTEPILKTPQERLPKGFFPGDEHTHEWGHITNAALEGWGTEGIKSHLNPSNPGKLTTAAAVVVPRNIDWKDPDSVAFNLGKVASIILGGASADELHSQIPFEINQGISGDLSSLKSKLKVVGFSNDEIESVIKYGLDRSKRNLTQPGIGDILNQNAKVRELGLEPEWHASPDRTEAYSKEVRRIQDENRHAAGQTRVNASGTDREAGRIAGQSDAGTEGKIQEESPRANLEVTRKLGGDDFKKWFGKSKMVDEKGMPLVAYHGTTSPIDFDEFSTEGAPHDEEGNPIIGSSGDPNAYLGAHFAIGDNAAKIASKFAENKEGWMRSRYEGEGAKPRVIPTHLKIENPAEFKSEKGLNDFINEGHISDEEALNAAMRSDGIENPEEGGEEVDDWINKYDNNRDFRREQNEWTLRQSSDNLGYSDESDIKEQLAQELGEQAKQRFIEKGHDGIIYKNAVEGGKAAIAFNSEQILHAIPNAETVKKAYPEKTYLETSRGLRERTTGDEELDGHIKLAGAIPAGSMANLALFHDPETGSTLALDKREITPDLVKQHLAESREKFNVGKSSVLPEVAEKAVQQSKKEGGGFVLDLRRGKPEDTGFIVEAMPEKRVLLDRDATAKDIQKFYNDNRQLFRDNPELRIGGYKNELNISAHTDSIEAAKKLAEKLDQKSVWDVKKGEEVQTGGKGATTKFASYPFEDRMADLRKELVEK